MIVRFAQSLLWISFFLTSVGQAADFRLEPYLGYGLGPLALGDKQIVNKEMSAYLLGIRAGFVMNKNLFLALDYSRVGPMSMKIKREFANYDGQPLIFNSFSTGAGLGIKVASLNFWFGYYPLSTLEEYMQSLKYTGTMYRVGLGVEIGKYLVVGLYRDTQSVKAILSEEEQSVICMNTQSDLCSDRATLGMTHFVVSTSL